MERYHPGVITLYFATMLVFTAWFQQPVFLALSLFTALVVSKATLGGQWGRRLGWSLLLGAIIGIWWAVKLPALYYPFWSTTGWAIRRLGRAGIQRHPVGAGDGCSAVVGEPAAAGAGGTAADLDG